MSQAYRIELKSSVQRTVTASDRRSYPVSLTQILPSEEMRDLLRAALAEAGYTESEGNPNKMRQTGPSGEEIVFDLESMEASASFEESREVSTEVSVRGVGESRKGAEKDAKRALQNESGRVGDQIAQQGKRELQKSLTQRLEESEEERQRHLNTVLQRVYADALKAKARQMGTVLSQNESMTPEGEYELTIQVEM